MIQFTIYHEVQEGDSIPALCLNHAMSYEEFMQWNPTKNPKRRGRDVLIQGEHVRVYPMQSQILELGNHKACPQCRICEVTF